MFQPSELVELTYNHSKHLAEFIGEGLRIHNNANTASYLFLIHTSKGTVEHSFPKNEISGKLKNKEISEPSSRTVNKYKKQLKQLQTGTISVGGILEKLGKVNQEIHS